MGFSLRSVKLPQDLTAITRIFTDGMRHYCDPMPEMSVVKKFWYEYIDDSLKTDLADIDGVYTALGGAFWVVTSKRPPPPPKWLQQLPDGQWNPFPDPSGPQPCMPPPHIMQKQMARRAEVKEDIATRCASSEGATDAALVAFLNFYPELRPEGYTPPSRDTDHDDRVVGHVGVQKHSATSCEIRRMAIDASVRRSGLGARLVARLRRGRPQHWVRHGPRHGALRKMWLHTLQDDATT